jgi:hypothetical protein
MMTSVLGGCGRAGGAGRRLAALVLVTATVLVGSAGVAAATTPKPALGSVPGFAPPVHDEGSGVFYRGANNRLIQRPYTDGVIVGPQDLGGVLTSGPAAITIGAEYAPTWAFVRGTDAAIWYRRFSRSIDLDEWGPWQRAGGRALGAPSVSCVGNAGAQPILYVRGLDKALWRRALDSDWQRIGGVLAADPGALTAPRASCPGGEDVFVMGTDRQVWEWTGGKAFHRVGGLTNLAPAALLLPTGEVDLFVRGVGADRALWTNRRATPGGTWTGWRRVGGIITSPPFAAMDPVAGDPTRVVYALGADGDLWVGFNALKTTAWRWYELP